MGIKHLIHLAVAGVCLPLLGCGEDEAIGGIFACSSGAGKELAFLYDRKENVTRVLNIGEGVGENGFYTTERGNSVSWEVESGKVATTFILLQGAMKMKVVSREGISTLNPLGSSKKTSFHTCRWVMQQK
jgi:hypothetical protein